MLLSEKLAGIDPAQIMMLLSTLGSSGLKELVGVMSGEAMNVSDSTNSADTSSALSQSGVTTLGVEEEAREMIIRFAREVGSREGAEEEYARRAAEFVDQFLVPAGLTEEVARMMKEARDAMGPEGYRVDAVENDVATEWDSLGGDVGAFLGMVGELEQVIESKVACVALAKVFFKLFLVPLKLAAPVARLLFNKKSELLKAFALKALFLVPDLLLKPGLFQNDKLFSGGVLTDLEIKKLLLVAALAPKMAAALKEKLGSSLVGLPMLLSEMVGESSGLELLLSIPMLFGIDSVATGSEEEQLLGTAEERLRALESALVDSSAALSAGVAESRFEIVAFAGEIGNLRGAAEEYVKLATAFVDQILIPAGLTGEIAELIREARKEDTIREGMFDGNSLPGIEVYDGDFGSLLSLVSDLESIVDSKLPCLITAKMFFKLLLAPLRLVGPVSRLIMENKRVLILAYMLKSLLVNEGMLGKLVTASLAPKLSRGATVSAPPSSLVDFSQQLTAKSLEILA
ncbi:hypothetical protein CSUI_003401 [Cystoisospora suis]|uniref:Uncharacterized protein n=1 Tax=Cystoisospora suis TaxID=483139 RepID=A0A2C6L5K5_9APIC|nr:hypothetical protein CSUI_003401 [Cystoisospora suis]